MADSSYLEKIEKNPAAASAQEPLLSNSFKVWVMGVIFFLTFSHLFYLVVFRGSTFLPKEVILGLVLFLVGYLWTQETRDRERMQNLNQALVEAQRKLQSAEVDTISSLIRIVEAKDPHVHGHSERVARLSLAIAAEMEFSASTRETIRRAALLHDLGMLAIKDEILKKPAKLTDQEWSIIKQHPKVAVDILASLKFLYLEKKIILHHHERMDGQGYPSKLRENEIPLESRIIAAAETFDEMISTTPYRGPLPRDVVISELQKASGPQLDPSIVSRLLKIVEKQPEFWPH